ncbi:DeoR/GlpR family DNA-binding transcription regulator [Corynebacterium bovis]|uniref:DeoR/GlpR family DNA-binding transcription regulator n=1 Tax=Corynebacterium bovis TaxID=36808 RepID=UPI003138903D
MSRTGGHTDPRPERRPEKRREQIVAYVTRHGTARVEDLARLLDVSHMTVHRDLDVLAADHLLERIRGGAAAVSPSMSELGVGQRRRLRRETKAALCAYAATLVDEGAVVAVDDSTTLEPIIGPLQDRDPSTLITHSLAAMAAHRDRTGAATIRLIGCGGRYFPETDSFLGADTVRQLRHLSADVSFVSTTSVRPTPGGAALFHPDGEAAETKRAVIDVGRVRVLVVDATKVDAPGVFHVADLAEFHHIVTDADTTPDQRELLAASGATVHVVGADGTARPAEGEAS